MTAAAGKLYLLTGDYGRVDSPITFLSYDPTKDSWTTLALPPTVNGQLLAAGDKVVAIAPTDESGPTNDAVFDPQTGSWLPLPEDPLGKSFDRSAAWLGDRLLLSGQDLVSNPGGDGPSLTRLAVLDESLSHWTLLPDSDIIGGYPMWTADRIVFPMTGSADGGTVGNWGRPYSYGGILDPKTGIWSPLPTPPSGHSGLEGYVGTVDESTLVAGHLHNPQAMMWTSVPEAPWKEGRTSSTMITSPDGVFLWGGAESDQNVADGYLLSL